MANWQLFCFSRYAAVIFYGLTTFIQTWHTYSTLLLRNGLTNFIQTWYKCYAPHYEKYGSGDCVIDNDLFFHDFVWDDNFYS